MRITDIFSSIALGVSSVALGLSLKNNHYRHYNKIGTIRDKKAVVKNESNSKKWGRNIMEKEIRSLSDLINAIKEIHSNSDQIFWFRGHLVKDWKLLPSVQREEFAAEDMEQCLANDFYARACVAMKDRPSQDFCGWLALMQHYGLPTRLLDWSQSPLIAAFFATKDLDNKYTQADGCIWVMAPSILNRLEIHDKHIYPMDKDTVLEMIRPAFSSKASNPELAKITNDKIMACYPVENNMRIYTQQSAFTVHNTTRSLEQLNSPDLLQKLIIPANCKQSILYELAMCGFTTRNIYPDIEHIAAELKENRRTLPR